MMLEVDGASQSSGENVKVAETRELRESTEHGTYNVFPPPHQQSTGEGQMFMSINLFPVSMIQDTGRNGSLCLCLAEFSLHEK